MNSRICLCTLEHTRFHPKQHYFRYKIYLYYIDLDELELLHKKVLFFGYNRTRPTSLHDKDYLSKERLPLKGKIITLLHEAGITKKITKIMLLTSAKYFSYVFNPVNFYYCLTSSGEIIAVVAEVNNTFGERHLYILDKKITPTPKQYYQYSSPKKFFVSPFNSSEGNYMFYISPVDNSLAITIELIREGQLIMNAVLKGSTRELTTANHIKTICSHPFLPHLTMPRIIWQAIKLYFLRRLPVYKKPIPTDKMTIRKIPPSFFQKICMNVVYHVFAKIKEGCLSIELPDATTKNFGDPGSSQKATITVYDYRFFSSSVTGGDIGFGEAYMKGEWDSDDLTAVLQLLINNRPYIDDGNICTAFVSKFFNMRSHNRKKNTTKGSKKNIREHYDQSNQFFSLFLDPNLVYSSGFYSTAKDSLKKAQLNKIHMIIKKARINTSDHVLEIGCGWGGFAIEAAKKTGCKITGITVSREQYDYATERVKKEKLEKQVTILLTDYRNVAGSYDKIVSIEMLEAVGHHYYETFFSCCEKLLKKAGLIVIQTITIPDFRYDRYRKQCDWIQKHIFPGGSLPSLTRLCQAMSKSTHFIIEDLENIGVHYARTLKDWRLQFIKNIDKISAMGFEDFFEKKWLYYLCSCEAGFATRVIGNLQLVFTRSNNTTLPTV